jgi:hypothetical protein
VCRDDVPTRWSIRAELGAATVEEWRRSKIADIPVAQGYGSSETGWIAWCQATFATVWWAAAAVS